MTQPNGTFAIIAFGPIEGENRISADRVFDGLISKNMWYITRPTKAISSGSRVLFYENGIGFRGSALVRDIVEGETRMLFGVQIYLTFSHRLVLDEPLIFRAPFNPRSIVNSLDFITNKAYWGQSFRSTPRRISPKDYLTITDHAERQEVKENA